MRTTFMAIQVTLPGKWYIKLMLKVRRLAVWLQELQKSFGERIVTFTPHVDTGDYVVRIINADKIVLQEIKSRLKYISIILVIQVEIDI